MAEQREEEEEKREEVRRWTKPLLCLAGLRLEADYLTPP